MDKYHGWGCGDLEAKRDELLDEMQKHYDALHQLNKEYKEVEKSLFDRQEYWDKDIRF